MPALLQTELAFVSLDFPGRTTLTIAEIAQRTGFCQRHILDLFDEGELVAIDGSSKGASRRALRIVAESYRDWINRHLTGPARLAFIAQLPPATQRELYFELGRRLGLAA